MTSRPAIVRFVGAGPGDPELLTLKAERLIRESQVLVYAGSLVPQAVVDLAPSAEKHDSSKMALEEFMGIIVRKAGAGKRVVRLSSGDPSLYGALGEQTEWLTREGIPYEIVPGVSSFLAAAAVLGRELTVPDVAQTVIVTRTEGRTKMPEREKLKELAAHRTTMAIFLSTQAIHKIQKELLAAYPAETPVAVVYKATWPDQKIVRGTLRDIADKVHAAGIFMTAIVIVGEALRAQGKRSKLYDASFGHSFRRASAKVPGRTEDAAR